LLGQALIYLTGLLILGLIVWKVIIPLLTTKKEPEEEEDDDPFGDEIALESARERLEDKKRHRKVLQAQLSLATTEAQITKEMKTSTDSLIQLQIQIDKEDTLIGELEAEQGEVYNGDGSDTDDSPDQNKDRV